MANSDASIEILIEVLAGRAQNDLNKVQGAMNGLRATGLQGAQSIRGLNTAFEALSGNAKFSFESLTQLSNLLPMMATRSGAVGVGVGVVGLAVFKAAKAALEFKNEELNAHLKDVADQAQAAAKGWDAYYKALADGRSKAQAQAAQVQATASTELEQSKKASDERIDLLEKDTKARQQALKDLDEGRFEAALIVAKEVDDVTDMVAVRARLNQAIASNTRLINAERGAHATAAIAVGVMTEKIRDLNKARKDSGTKEADDARAAAFARTEQYLEGILAFTEAEEEETAAMHANTLEAIANFEAHQKRINQPTPRSQAAEFDALADAQMRLGQMTVYALGDIGAAAFDRYYVAMDRVIDGQNAFSKSSGRAMQNAAASTLKSLGQQAAAQAVMHLAMAAATASGAFVNVGMYGTPQDNLKAAAMFGTVAVMAGAGGAALSVKGGGGGGGSFGADRADRADTGRSGPNITVISIGNLDTQQRKDLGAQLRQEFYEGAG